MECVCYFNGSHLGTEIGKFDNGKMVMTTGKHSFAKSTIIWGFASLVALALTVNFLWASSSSSSSTAYISIASALSRPKNYLVFVQNTTTATDKKKKDGDEIPTVKVPTRLLPAAFADIPAPKMEWEQMSTAPVPRLDGYSIQIKNLFYVFCGFGDLDHVHSHVDVYNFTDDTWSDHRIDTPKEMANSHLGIASDGRYIYLLTGQHGPQCRGPTAKSFVLDTKTQKFSSFPALPAPRYAPATQLWRGRLHVMGGSQENRHTPALDHWSIAVKNGKAIEKEWRKEVPVPRGGPHRSCIPVGDRLYVIGGQEGDFQAKPQSPIFKCSRRREILYGDVYMLDENMKWHKLPPIPKANSHIECSWVLINNSIIILGGTTENHPINKRMMLVGEVFRFDLDSQEWSVIGRLPYRIKTALAAFWDGWLYFTSGQRDRGPENPQPRQVVGDMWRTKLSL